MVSIQKTPHPIRVALTKLQTKLKPYPSLDTPTIPISTDQEMHGEIVQGVLDDPKIPRSLVGAAWERAKNHF